MLKNSHFEKKKSKRRGISLKKKKRASQCLVKQLWLPHQDDMFKVIHTQLLMLKINHVFPRIQHKRQLHN